MSFFDQVNVFTIIMIGLFLAPIIMGIIHPFRSLQLERSIGSLLSNLLFLGSILLSVYLTGILLSNSVLMTEIYKIVPQLQKLVTRYSGLTYAILMILLTVLLEALLHLLIMPAYTYLIVPVIEKMASSFRKKDGFLRRTVWGLCQFPRSVVYVLIFSLILNFCASFSSNTINKKINQSVTYQFVDKNILSPLLSSSIVKKIPVLLNNSFKDASSSLQNIHLIRYFNGMTLDDAVRSNSEIDNTARKIVGKETNSKEKAYLIYRWVSTNISYDYAKVTAVSTDPSSVTSGAVVAFKTRSGICFDYACLYVAMCRAVDVKVRFITGMGYSGVEWGDHAWNQVYSPADKRWINVDTTFGNSGNNYFDRANFSADHQNAEIQGEW